jgi:hypothetical protein
MQLLKRLYRKNDNAAQKDYTVGSEFHMSLPIQLGFFSRARQNYRAAREKAATARAAFSSAAQEVAVLYAKEETPKPTANLVTGIAYHKKIVVSRKPLVFSYAKQRQIPEQKPAK